MIKGISRFFVWGMLFSSMLFIQGEEISREKLAQSETSFTRGLNLYLNREFLSAATVWQQLLKKFPENEIAQRYMEKAYDLYQRERESFLEGRKLYQQGKYSLAIARLKEALRINPHNNLSRTYLELAYGQIKGFENEDELALFVDEEIARLTPEDLGVDIPLTQIVTIIVEEFSLDEGRSPKFVWLCSDFARAAGYNYLLSVDRNQPLGNKVRTTRNNKKYENLEPGLYHFLVKVKDKSGIWSEPYTTSYLVPEPKPLVAKPEFLALTNYITKVIERTNIVWITNVAEVASSVGVDSPGLVPSRPDVGERRLKPAATMEEPAVSEEGLAPTAACPKPGITVSLPKEKPLTQPSETELDYIESTVRYTIKKGDILSRVVHRFLKTRGGEVYRYLEPVGRFNRMKDINRIRPKQRLGIPCLAFTKPQKLDFVSEKLFGEEKYQTKLIAYDHNIGYTSGRQLESNIYYYRIFIKDKHFLSSGKLSTIPLHQSWLENQKKRYSLVKEKVDIEFTPNGKN